jgi:isorenieratene synthase
VSENVPTTSSQQSHHIVVIGAGLAGLTAALHVAERGLSVTVLDADPDFAGGRLRGGPPAEFDHKEQRWSFPSEHGIHGVWNQYHNLQAMLARYNIDAGYVPSRKESWILRHLGSNKIQWAEGGSALRSSWVPAPFHYLALFVRPRFLQMMTLRDIASMFRLLSGLMLAMAYDPAVEGVQLEGYTLSDFFRGWSPTLRALFTGLARNFTSAEAQEVPQSGFIAFLRFYTLLRRDAWSFRYFNRDSNTAMIAPLRAKLESLGGTVRLNTTVTGLQRHGDGWQVHWQDGSRDISITADQVILALDVPGARDVLTNSDPTKDRAQNMHWPIAVPTAVVRFWFSQSPRGALAGPEAGIFTGDFVLDNYFWLHRFQEPFKSWNAATGGTAIESHIYGPPDVLKEPDASILARAVLDLYRTWPNLRGTVIHQTIRRNPPTHSLFSVGQTDQHLGVETGWEKLWSCGDWVRYPHPSLYMERAVTTGIAAANAALNTAGLETWPIREADKPEFLARGVERFWRWVRRNARKYNQWRRSR